jgi:Flp pilus assembly protein TadD
VWLAAAEVRGDDVALRKAMGALQTAAGHPDVSSETLTDLGRASMRSGNWTAAERAFRLATSKRPVDPDAYLHLATVTARVTRLEDARDALITYATLTSDRKPLAAIATQIATYSVQLGEPQVAEDWIERAVDEAGETPRLADLRRLALALRN